MIRQRVNLRTPALALLVRALTLLLALGLLWYGLMVVLLAVKVSPHTVNSISAYRTLYDDLIGLHEHDFTTARRLIAGAVGVFTFLILLVLALQELPRPYLARQDTRLPGGEGRGTTTVQPRALERLAEAAARSHPAVGSASGRLGDGHLYLSIGLRRPGTVVDDLREIHRRVRSELVRHEMPTLPVDVTLTSLEERSGRNLR